jgi:cytoskeletal protein RodZ
MTPEAAARINARKRRIGLLRRGVVATALSVFALAFGLVAFDGSRGATDSASQANAATQSSSSSSSSTTSATDNSSSSNGTTSAAPVATHAS